MAGALAWVTNDAERVDALVDECGFAAAPFVGLGVEWTPSFVRGQAERPALLQLAARQRHARAHQPDGGARRVAAAAARAPRRRRPLRVNRGVGLDAQRLGAIGLDIGAVDELPGRLGLKQLAKERRASRCPAPAAAS